MKTMSRIDTRGFSLMELIVVIALISILGTMTFQMSGILVGRRAYATQEKLGALIGRTKGLTLAWSQGGFTDTSQDVDVKLTLQRKSDGIYALLRTRKEEESIVLNTDRVQITAVRAKGRDSRLTESSRHLLTENDEVLIAFDKKTGALLPDEEGRYVKQLILSEGEKSYTITLVPATGMVETQTKGMRQVEK